MDEVTDIHVVGWLNDLMEDLMEPFLATVFGYVAGPMALVMQTVALVAVLFIAVNQIFQFTNISMSQYMFWGIRYVLISTFAFVWGNFEPIYDLLKEIPNDYSALMTESIIMRFAIHRQDILDPTGINDAYDALDAISGTLFWMAEDFFRDTAWNAWGMSLKNIGLGILFGILGGIWTAISAIIMMIAKLGLIMSIALAPLAICMLMMEQTRKYFESWTQLVLSFLVIPLLLATLANVLLFAACEILIKTDAGSDNKETYLIFAVIVVASFVLLWRLPEMGQTISGSAAGSAGMNGLRKYSKQAMGAAWKAPGTVGHYAKAGAGKVFHGGQRLRDAAHVAAASRRSGAGWGRTAWGTINAMRQSSYARQTRRDNRLAARTRGLPGSGGSGGGGGGTSSSERGGGKSNSGSKMLAAGRVGQSAIRAARDARQGGASGGKTVLAGMRGAAKGAGNELKRREARRFDQSSNAQPRGRPNRSPSTGGRRRDPEDEN